jgi:hypothetical protein
VVRVLKRKGKKVVTGKDSDGERKKVQEEFTGIYRHL